MDKEDPRAVFVESAWRSDNVRRLPVGLMQASQEIHFALKGLMGAKEIRQRLLNGEMILTNHSYWWASGLANKKGKERK